MASRKGDWLENNVTVLISYCCVRIYGIFGIIGNIKQLVSGLAKAEAISRTVACKPFVSTLNQNYTNY